MFWKTRNWFSTSSFSPFLKTEITFAILSFSGKASSSRDVLTVDKNGLYRIADININITVKTVATSGLASFQLLERYFEFLKRKFIMLHPSIAFR